MITEGNNFIIVFPPRDDAHGYKDSWAFYMAVARQMGLAPYWQTMGNEWNGPGDTGYISFTVPDDFLPATTNEPI